MQKRVVMCDVEGCDASMTFLDPSDVRNHQIPEGWTQVELQRVRPTTLPVCLRLDVCGAHGVESVLNISQAVLRAAVKKS